MGLAYISAQSDGGGVGASRSEGWHLKPKSALTNLISKRVLRMLEIHLLLAVGNLFI
jgi:hypothetical protein